MFHKKTTANFITAIFAILIIVQVFSFLTVNIVTETSNTVSASIFEKGKNPLDTLQIKIPGLNTKVADGQIIGEYVSAIYRYAIGSIGILATVVMMFGGMLWITAAGNTEQIGKAKSYITASLTGLVLALTSWMILYQVNPDLTNFASIKIIAVEEHIPKKPRTNAESGSLCTWKATGATNNCLSLNGYEDGTGKCTGPSSDTYNTCCCRTATSLYDDTISGCCTYIWHEELQCLNETELGCYLSAESKNEVGVWSEECPTTGCTAEAVQSITRGCCLHAVKNDRYQECNTVSKESCDRYIKDGDVNSISWQEKGKCENIATFWENFWNNKNIICK